MICGRPGSGKSTLAMQFAAQCARRPENRAVSAYISLEATAEEVWQKTRPFGWDEYLLTTRHLHEVDDLTSADDLAEALLEVLTQPEDCPKRPPHEGRGGAGRSAPGHEHLRYVEPKVLLSCLTPRPISKPDDGVSLFWTRFQQIEALLSAAVALRRKKRSGTVDQLRGISHILPLVVLDGLDMFTGTPLTREEMHQLFRLFRRHETLGVFVAETSHGMPFDSTLADVVISLTSQEDGGYLTQHVEIEKSRYTRHVRGRQPFKIQPLYTDTGPEEESPETQEGRPEDQREAQYAGEKRTLCTPVIPGKDEEPALQRHGFVVFPSLHYVVLKTDYEPGSYNPQGDTGGKFTLGDEDIDLHGLPPNLPHGSVVTLEGPRGTFKSALANTFLIDGLREKLSVLLLRFNDQPYYTEGPRKPRLSKKQYLKSTGTFRWDDLEPTTDTEPGRWANLASEHKVSISRWQYAPSRASWPKPHPVLYEIDFKGGALLPEEFVHIVREVLIRAPHVRRVAVHDVEMTGVNYPFLKHSSTTGDMFLGAFTHIMRNAGVDLLMTATRGGLAEANAMVDRAVVLSDAVLSSEYCDIFGKREVVLRPQGVVGGRDDRGRSATQTATSLREVTPMLLRPEGDKDKRLFVVDTDSLHGFVGFGTGHIHRAGLSLFLFEENDGPHRTYNDDVERMVRAAMAESRDQWPGSKPVTRAFQDVSVFRFGSDASEAVHESLGIFPGASPLERTALYTVDEFWKGAEDIHRKLDEPRPYYRNLLLLAVRRGPDRSRTWPPLGESLPAPQKFESWRDVVSAARKAGPGGAHTVRGFWCDLSASETLSCVLMDALASGWTGPRGASLFDEIFKRDTLSDDQVDELEALCDLFSMMEPIEEREKHLLPADAALYVCWYSQLRELIAREPNLGEQLDVAPLPGGGFTGDWYIGVAKGSVSSSLGKIITNKLTHPAEDYRRFALGVGLPAGDILGEEENDVFAWPRARHVPLSLLLKGIHQNAWSRSDITGYPRFRSALSTICRHLTPLAGPALDSTTSSDRPRKVRVLVERVLKRVPLLRDG